MTGFTSNAELHSSQCSIDMGVAPDLSMNANLSIAKFEAFRVRPETTYFCEVLDVEGNLKWCDTFHNLVTDSGRNAIIDATFKTGNASPVWYIGLVSDDRTPVYENNDTMGNHAGWGEFSNYSEETRQTFVPGEISDGEINNSLSKALFTISSGGGVIAGCFLVDNSTKGEEGVTGILYGVGTFSSGTRPVDEGDTIRITTVVNIAEVT